ncbi:MAG: RidA family protein [Pseudomonadota bacterium]
MPIRRIDIARKIAASHGFDLDDAVRVGGNYVPVTEHRGTAWISGQVPRIGSTVVATGHVGQDLPLEAAQQAAAVCALRAIAILEQVYGLDRVERVLKLGVFVQAAPGFTLLSEVADGASDLLAAVFGAQGTHARTSVGVLQLPKNAAVELDLTVALAEG